MSFMHKIGVVGDYESVCGFSALGLDTFYAEDAQSAYQIVKRLVKNIYGIIYVIEEYMEELSEVYEKYSEMQIPAIVPIPSAKGAMGFGMERVKRNVNRAVGSDIIFNQN